MRKAYFLLLLAPAAIAYACGGGTDTGDGGTDATPDNTTSDSSTDGGKDSGPDAVSDASDAAVDVVISVTCLHPADCIDGAVLDAAYPPSSGEVCCGTLVTTGTLPNCTFDSVVTQCEAPGSCASNIPLQLTCGTDTVRGCQHASECVEANFDSCCRFSQGDAGIQICFSAQLAGMAGATCLDAGQ